ncbi:probable Target of rapamycin complex 1 subunit KOG1 [Zygosaccharomyces bailii]|nr:probable Target of rapamycin complex 1 subunit KOG1 [Zygosaccharomyces bailii]
MPVIYGPQPLRPLNVETRHGFDEQYHSEQFLQTLANDFIFYYDDKRHKTNGNPTPEEDKIEDAEHYYQPIHDWKIMKDRQKTVSAALLLCLNLGVDPPDVIKTQPCARVESWVDPLNFQDSKKAIEQIGKNLQAQYETLSLRTRYKQSLDPCVGDVKRFCNSLRRTSKDDRILFHYNGHGVPQPTPSGEIWVFNRGYTQYIPVSLYDLQTWLGAPCIFVYDCNNAGNIVSNFKKFVQKRIREEQDGIQNTSAPSPSFTNAECFQLASCRSDELLLMSPELPADLFTCCLTCPIEISVRVFLMQTPLKDSKYKILFENPTNNEFEDDKNSYKSKIPNVIIPGVLSDRRTPLGELNWIFTAITDTIAWTSLPRPLFKKLFRHDLMVAALFRNFLLAKRIMPWYNSHPISDPELPDSIAHHPMWQSWDLALDEVLSKLVNDLKNSPPASDLGSQFILQQQESLQNQAPQRQDNKSNSIQGNSRFAVANLSTMSLANHPAVQGASKRSQASLSQQPQQQQQQQFTGFFEQNLTAFELWLKYASNTRHPPEQLPIVLQVLLSQVHRIRALVLLSRFLDLGPWAVYLSLSIGIFPYVLKLLQSPAPELKPILVFIWSRVMSIDYKNTQAELIKEKGFMYFISVLVPDWGLLPSPASGTSIAPGSALSMTASPNMNGTRGQHYQSHNALYSSAHYHSNDTTDEQKAMAVFVLSSFVRDFPLGQKYCFSLDLVNKLSFYIDNSDIPLLRQWCIILIGQLCTHNSLYRHICMNAGIIDTLLRSLKDPVPEVRTAVVLALKNFISDVDDSDQLFKLQQEFEQQYQQLHAQMQQLQSSSHQQQSHHIEQQQMKIEQQIQHCQIMQLQMQNIEPKKLKKQEITNLVGVLGLINDGSPLVRKEVIIFLSHVVFRYINFFIVVAFNELIEEIIQMERTDTEAQSYTDKHAVSHGSVFSTIWEALLILAEDPYRENRALAGQVVDYVLLELSTHKDLSYAFSKIEHYLIKRSVGLGQGRKSPSNTNSQVQLLKKPNLPFSNDKHDSSPEGNGQEPKDKSNRSKGTSLGKFLQTLGLGNSKNRSESNLRGLMNEHDMKPTNTSFLSAPHGMAPLAKIPRSRKLTGPLTLPLSSTFLDYSREYFQEPQMRKHETDEPGSIEYSARLWRRNRNENIIQQTQGEKKLALYGDWSNRLTTFDNKTQPKLIKFAQFESFLVSADERDEVTVFDWENNTHLARFSNGNPFGTKVTDLKFLNEDDAALLLTGSSDGIIKIYKNIHSCDELELVSAWRGLTDMLLTPRSSGLLTEWQQIRGSLLTTGDVKIIRVWDAHTETVEVDIPAKTSSLITSITSDQLAGNIVVAGFADGALRVYDRRIDPRDSMVRLWRPGTGTRRTWINNVHMQRGGYRELVSGSTNGVVELWDVRMDEPVGMFRDENLQQQNGQKRLTTMTTTQVHEHAPIIATGTKQVKIWTTSGDLLSNFKNHHSSGGVAGTLAATGIRSTLSSSNAFLSSMAFHPHRMILAAANSHDTSINVYKCENRNTEFY